MRLFTALEIDHQNRRIIYDWKERNAGHLLKSVPEQNYHITLNFFGELGSAKLESLVSKIDEHHQNIDLKTFKLNLDQLAYWPKTGIAWIGPRETPPALVELAKRHRHIGAQLGCKKSKHDYQAHITLARGLETFSSDDINPDIQIAIKHYALFESLRTPRGGVQYQVIERWPLNTNRLPGRDYAPAP